MNVIYLGPHDEIELVDGQIVQRGATVEVSEDLGPRLLEQVGSFAPVKVKQSAKAAGGESK